ARLREPHRGKGRQHRRTGRIPALSSCVRGPEDFETLLGIEGVGPKTLRALVLASELLRTGVPLPELQDCSIAKSQDSGDLTLLRVVFVSQPTKVISHRLSRVKESLRLSRARPFDVRFENGCNEPVNGRLDPNFGANPNHRAAEPRQFEWLP